MTPTFLDANPFIYLLTKEEGKWQKALEIFTDKKRRLFSNFFVLNEVKFKLLWIDAEKAYGTNKKFEIIKKIRQDGQLRKRTISGYHTAYVNLKRTVAFLHTTEEIEQDISALIIKEGLLPTDASIIAHMRKNSIKELVTNDDDFDKIEGITIVPITSH